MYPMGSKNIINVYYLYNNKDKNKVNTLIFSTYNKV